LNYTRGKMHFTQFPKPQANGLAIPVGPPKKIHDCCQSWIPVTDLPPRCAGKSPSITA